MAQQLEELEQEVMSPNGSHESVSAPEVKPAPAKEDRPSLLKRLGRRPLIAAAGLVADAILVIEADIEPHGRVERAVLVDAKPRQFLVKHLAVSLAEVTVLDAPIGNGAADTMDELAHGGFALGGALLAVKVFRHHHLVGQDRPGLGHLDVLLFEDHLAGVVGDLGGAAFPFELIERADPGVAERPGDGQRIFYSSAGSLSAA